MVRPPTSEKEVAIVSELDMMATRKEKRDKERKMKSLNITASTSLETLWDMYHATTEEKVKVEKKLSRAEASCKEWKVKASKCKSEDEALYMISERVAPRSAKVVKVKRELETVKREIKKVKAAIVRKADELGL